MPPTAAPLLEVEVVATLVALVAVLTVMLVLQPKPVLVVQINSTTSGTIGSQYGVYAAASNLTMTMRPAIDLVHINFRPENYVSIRGHDGEFHTFVVAGVEPLPQ
jgi:hypothetical protein